MILVGLLVSWGLSKIKMTLLDQVFINHIFTFSTGVFGRGFYFFALEPLFYDRDQWLIFNDEHTDSRRALLFLFRADPLKNRDFAEGYFLRST